MSHDEIQKLISDATSDNEFIQSAALVRIKQEKIAEAEPTLFQLLVSDDALVVIMAAQALCALGTQQADEVSAKILPLLKNSESSVRIDALYTLGGLKATYALTEIANILLQDQDAVVRATASEVIADLGDVSGADSLLSALGDEDFAVRSCCANALGIIGRQEHVTVLTERLNAETNSVVKANMLGALLRLGENHFMKEFVELLSSVSEENIGALLHLVEDLLGRNTPEAFVKSIRELISVFEDLSEKFPAEERFIEYLEEFIVE